MNPTAHHQLENNQPPFLGSLPRTCLQRKTETRLLMLSLFRAVEKEKLFSDPWEGTIFSMDLKLQSLALGSCWIKIQLG